jgi:DNA/RNA-binding domain of Phe-tRNA-synthetase-like protein
VRTRLTESSTAAYFLLERLEPLPVADLLAAGDGLEVALRGLSPGCRITRRLLPQ